MKYIFVLLSFLVLLNYKSSAAFSEQALVKFSLGKVYYKYHGKRNWKRASLYSKLYKNTQIKVFKKSVLELIFTSGARVRFIGPGNFTISDISKRMKRTYIKIKNGWIFAKIKGKSDFKIFTPTAIAGVRGTHFYLAALKNGVNWICVKKGKVLVSNIKKTLKRIIPAGKGIRIIPGINRIEQPRVYEWTKRINWQWSKNANIMIDN